MTDIAATWGDGVEASWGDGVVATWGEEAVTRVRARFDIELSAADEDEVVALFFGIVLMPRRRG